MTTLDTTLATTTTGSTSTNTAAAQSSQEEDFNTFLQLLTTQLQNQDPTDPLDTNEFTQQLVSYSQLEQSINQSASLDSIESLIGSFVNANAISYVGDIVTIDGALTQLESGEAQWTYSVDRNGVSGSIEIRNEAGDLIKTDQPNTAAGQHVYRWDGRTDNGEIAPDGDYSIRIAIQDSNDTAVPVSTTIDGRVEEVDVTTNPPTLIVAGQRVPVDAVRSVKPST